MYPVIIFRAAATNQTVDVTVVGGHSVTPGAADTHVVSHTGTNFNLTDEGLTDYQSKVNEIAKYGVVEITG